MRYSTQIYFLAKKYGIKKAADMTMDAGFTALDLTIHGSYTAPDTQLLESPIYSGEYKSFAKELRERAESRGVIYNQAHAPFPTENKLDLLPRAIEFASLLGAKAIVMHPVFDVEYYGNEEAAFLHNIEFFNSIKKYALDFGIKIAIENTYRVHPVSERILDTVGSSPEDLAGLYDTLGGDPFTLCVDIGHAALSGREPDRFIRQLSGGRVTALHVHDVDYINDLHTLPGLSKLNFNAVCRALGEIGYNGEITLEADNFLSGFDESFYPDALAFMARTAQHLALKIESYKIKG